MSGLSDSSDKSDKKDTLPGINRELCIVHCEL